VSKGPQYRRTGRAPGRWHAGAAFGRQPNHLPTPLAVPPVLGPRPPRKARMRPARRPWSEAARGLQIYREARGTLSAAVLSPAATRLAASAASPSLDAAAAAWRRNSAPTHKLSLSARKNLCGACRASGALSCAGTGAGGNPFASAAPALARARPMSQTEPNHRCRA